MLPRGADPWVRFSPFFPHGDIPVPMSPGFEAESVEGIWQGLKVFETSDVDVSRFSVTSMKGLKRTSTMAKHAPVFRTVARKRIYLPVYKWVLDNRLGEVVDELRDLAAGTVVVLLDYNVNCDVEDVSRPLSHAGLVKWYVEDKWPE